MKTIFMMCFSFLGFSLFAQETQAPDSTFFLDELVISANKIPEMRSKVAQQVQAITNTQIKNLSVQTTADLLSNSGVVTVQKSQQGGGSPQLRGFEANKVVLVIDGVRMNNLIYRAGHLQNIITLDNNSLEGAEILFGPSSTVYGSDALGGVISLRTKDVMLSGDQSKIFKGNSFFRYGSVNSEKTSHIDFNLGGKRFGAFTSFTYSDFGDLKMGKNTNRALGKPFGLRNFYVERSADNTQDMLVANNDPYVQRFSGYSQFDIIQKFLFKQNDRVKHVFNVQYSNSSNVPRYDRLTDVEGAGLRTAEWYYGPQKRIMASYQLGIKNPGKIGDALQATVSYQNIEESRHDRRFNRPNRRNQIEDVDVFGLTINLNKRVGRHDLRYGFDSQFNKLKSTAYNLNVVSGERSSVNTRYPDGNNSMRYYALYFTHTYDINNFLTLTDGLRIGASSLHSTFENKTISPFPFNEVKQKNTYASGNIGLIYRPDSWKFSFLTSTGYRVPNVDDLGKVFDSKAGESLIVPNPDIKPEKTLNFEFSILKYFGEKVRWENTAYYTSLFDAIVVDGFKINGLSVVDYDGKPTQVFASQNKSKAYITGLSSVLHGELSSKLSMDASLNYTYGRIKTESTHAPLDHIAPTFGRVNLIYHKNKFRSEVFTNFNGWKKIKDFLLNGEDNEAYAPGKGMPSWYTINFRVAYSFNKHVTLQGGVDNLLDLQYRTFGSGINSPGRNFFGTLRVSI